MRLLLQKQVLRTFQLWDERSSHLWRSSPRRLLSVILSNTQGVRLSTDEKLELSDTVQKLVRHKRLLDFLADRLDTESTESIECPWSRRLKALQSSQLKDLQSLEHAGCAEPVLVSFPDKLYTRISSHLGPRVCRGFCDISNEIPTWTFLRRNATARDMDSLLSNLTNLGHKAEKCQEAENCIKVETACDSANVSRVPLSQLPLYLSGELEIQDESSQLVAQLVQCRPTDTVVDLCCGSGGKSLAIASRLQQGCLVLHDTRVSSMKRAKQRFLRAQAAEGQGLQGAQGAQRPQDNCNPQIHFVTAVEIAAWEKSAHWVVIDAPCSNTGSLRRHPECKYRFFEDERDNDSFLQLQQTQRDLLRSAKKLLVSGGSIVYSTCSVLPEENESQIEWAEQQLGLAICDIQSVLPERRSRDGYFAAVLKSTPKQVTT